MRSATRPLVVVQMGRPEQSCMALDALDLRRSAASGGHDEGWLQDLIDRHPAILPLADVEPALAGALSVCRELPTPSGFADNLLMTPEGGIVLVEAKLWRNPQARREVIGQVLDYAKDLKRWSYEELETAVQRARRDRTPLAELVCGAGRGDVDAAVFFDAVSRNLRLGRFVCIVAGDGIQESAEQLAEFIGQHVGLHFTLAMVELSLWRIPDRDDVIVHPRVILRTVQIERPVVRTDPAAETRARPLAPAQSQSAKPVTISGEQFYEQLARTAGPGGAGGLAEFASRSEADGIRQEIRKGLSLKWRSHAGSDYTLAFVHPDDGLVYFDYCNWAADGLGRVDLSHAYLADVAALIPAGDVRRTPKPTGWYVRSEGRAPALAVLLTRSDLWREAMLRYTGALRMAEPQP